MISICLRFCDLYHTKKVLEEVEVFVITPFMAIDFLASAFPEFRYLKIAF